MEASNIKGYFSAGEIRVVKIRSCDYAFGRHYAKRLPEILSAWQVGNVEVEHITSFVNRSGYLL